jgi:hypothetical protein
MLLRFCWWAHDISLLCYPAALREDFGAEMSDVFRQQTLDAWAEGRWRRLVAVIWYAVRELFTEGLPALIGSQEVIAGASSLVCTSATFWCLLWALANPLAVKAAGDRIQHLLWHGAACCESTARVGVRHR